MKKELEKLLNSCLFGKRIFTEYYDGNLAGFNHDKRKHDIDKAMAKNLLKDIKRIDSKKMLEALQFAYGGRLNYGGKGFHYTAGQFYDIELPSAICAVLKYYQELSKK